MVQKKVEQPKATKKSEGKKPAKKAATKTSPDPGRSASSPAVPSYLLRLPEATPENFSYLGFANETWGLVWRPSNDTQRRSLYRQPLFTLTGAYGERFDALGRATEMGIRSLNHRLRWGEYFTGEGDDLRVTADLSYSASSRANLRWIQLWLLNDLDCLNALGAPDDSYEGDRQFVTLVELLLMVEEVSDLFRGTNSDIREAMEACSWLHPQGPGLLLLSHLRQLAHLGFTSKSGFQRSRLGAFHKIYTNCRSIANESVLLELREASGEIFGKVLEVLQSPAMESRFRAFFGGLARELNVSPEELWNAMYGMSSSSYGDSSYISLLSAKLGQVFGLLKDVDGAPETLSHALETWTAWIRDAPKNGWPIGPEYEARANSERLKLISNAQRKGLDQRGKPEKQRLF